MDVFLRICRFVQALTKEQGLPEADNGIQIYAAEKNRIIAAGSFGINKRAWCALVTCEDGIGKVKVFHEATRVLQKEKWDNSNASIRNSPYLCFEPSSKHLFHTDNNSDHILLIDGAGSRSGALQINLDTLKVSVFKGGNIGDTDDHISYNGWLFWANSFDVYGRRYVPDKEKEEGVTLFTTNGGMGAIRFSEKLIFYDGWVYVPGTIWYRFRPDTLEKEQLTPRRLHEPYNDLDCLAVSLHYGLISLNPFIKISVKEKEQ